jgi:hypothetical protein
MVPYEIMIFWVVPGYFNRIERYGVIVWFSNQQLVVWEQYIYCNNISFVWDTPMLPSAMSNSTFGIAQLVFYNADEVHLLWRFYFSFYNNRCSTCFFYSIQNTCYRVLSKKILLLLTPLRRSSNLAIAETTWSLYMGAHSPIIPRVGYSIEPTPVASNDLAPSPKEPSWFYFALGRVS